MNRNPLNPTLVGRVSGFLCLASAILVTGFALEGIRHLQGQANVFAQLGSELTPAIFAHSVQLEHRAYAQFDRIRTHIPNPASIRTPDWYRYVLPISIAVLMLSFSVWTLQTQPNASVCRLESHRRG